jgi:hypothetical protein
VGSWSIMDRATVSPPTPESKTPMGRDPTGPLVLLAAESDAAASDGSTLEAVVMIIRG